RASSHSRLAAPRRRFEQHCRYRSRQQTEPGERRPRSTGSSRRRVEHCAAPFDLRLSRKGLPNRCARMIPQELHSWVPCAQLNHSSALRSQLVPLMPCRVRTAAGSTDDDVDEVRIAVTGGLNATLERGFDVAAAGDLLALHALTLGELHEIDVGL